jgi:hypothetical protein
MNLDSAVQLHEVVEIRYLIKDCYEATLFTQDGDREVAVGVGATVQKAIKALRRVVRENFHGIDDVRDPNTKETEDGRARRLAD